MPIDFQSNWYGVDVEMPTDYYGDYLVLIQTAPGKLYYSTAELYSGSAGPYFIPDWEPSDWTSDMVKFWLQLPELI